MLMLPEIIVIATAVAVLVLDLFLTERGRAALAYVALGGLAAAFLATLLAVPPAGEMLGGRFGMDGVAWWFKLLFLLAGFVTVAISADLLDGGARVRMRGIGFRGEYYCLLLFSITGMMVLISARDLVSLYVSLELATIPLFVLAAWRRGDAQSGEAGLKYVIVGALASALILYGLGILYGLTGQTGLAAIRGALQDGPAFWLAAALVMAGVGFKLTIVPFHMWAADVYQGASAPVTAYLSVGSKAAGLAFLFQLFFRVFGANTAHWGMLVALFAAATMTLGNVVAIVQENIKRFMAFSAISQAGYFLLGFLGSTDDGVTAMLFYLLVYLATNLTVFACIVWYSNETGREEIKDYRGLSRTNPLVALAMTVGLFSLAGIPPLSGFVGKFFLFSIASKAGFHWLVAVAAVNSTISLYYYLRIVRQMYIEPTFEGAERLTISRRMALTVGALAVSQVFLGIVPFFYKNIHAHTAGWLATLMK
jgi:NADH-quinone oxidoreductase subunit N